jgi:hypothetical protein
MEFEKFNEFIEVLIYVLGNDKFDKYSAEGVDNLYYAAVKEIKFNLVLAKTNEAREGVFIYCLSEIAWQKSGIRTPNEPPIEGEEVHTIAYFNSLNFFIELEKLAYFYDIDYKKILDRMGLELLEYDILNNNIDKQVHTNKLKWLGKPSHLGFIMNLLAENGFIEIPKTNGEQSYSKYAKVLLELFDVRTTLQNLANEVNPEKTSLGYTNKLKFIVPNINDLK